MPWSSHSCNDLRYSYFTRYMCNRYAVLKPFLEHDRKHVLRLSRLFLDGDPAWISCRLYIFCHIDISVESIGRFICRQDQSNEEPLFIRPQFASQFGVFHLLGFIKRMQHFNLNVFLYTPFKMLCQHWIMLQIRTLHALSFIVVDCGNIGLGFMVHLKRLLHITWHF